jgi:hypothetical protein
VPHVDVTFARRVADRADFDVRFGEGRPLPRVDYDRPFLLAYEVSVEGAPARCTVFAQFEREPESGEVEAGGAILRIDPKYEPQTE